MPYKQEKKSFFSCLILFFSCLRLFSPGSKASRKSGLTRTQIKTFSRSKVNPEKSKKVFFFEKGFRGLLTLDYVGFDNGTVGTGFKVRGVVWWR